MPPGLGGRERLGRGIVGALHSHIGRRCQRGVEVSGGEHRALVAPEDCGGVSDDTHRGASNREATGALDGQGEGARGGVQCGGCSACSWHFPVVGGATRTTNLKFCGDKSLGRGVQRALDLDLCALGEGGTVESSGGGGGHGDSLAAAHGEGEAQCGSRPGNSAHRAVVVAPVGHLPPDQRFRLRVGAGFTVGVTKDENGCMAASFERLKDPTRQSPSAAMVW